jgi:hypothetical protein
MAFDLSINCHVFAKNIRIVLNDPTNDMLQTHKPLNLNFGTFYEVQVERKTVKTVMTLTWYRHF